MGGVKSHKAFYQYQSRVTSHSEGSSGLPAAGARSCSTRLTSMGPTRRYFLVTWLTDKRSLCRYEKISVSKVFLINLVGDSVPSSSILLPEKGGTFDVYSIVRNRN